MIPPVEDSAVSVFLKYLEAEGAGVVFGIPVGMGIARILVKLYDNELYRLPYYIAPKTYVIATVATIVFVILANLAVKHKIRALDMVEVLKARE